MTSTVLKIEPIGLQQNVQIDRDYQNAMLNFGIYEEIQSWQKSNISKKIFIFQKPVTYVKEHFNTSHRLCVQNFRSLS